MEDIYTNEEEKNAALGESRIEATKPHEEESNHHKEETNSPEADDLHSITNSEEHSELEAARDIQEIESVENYDENHISAETVESNIQANEPIVWPTFSREEVVEHTHEVKAEVEEHPKEENKIHLVDIEETQSVPETIESEVEDHQVEAHPHSSYSEESDENHSALEETHLVGAEGLIEPENIKVAPDLDFDPIGMDLVSLNKIIIEAYHHVDSKEYCDKANVAHKEFFRLIEEEKEAQKVEFEANPENADKKYYYNNPLVTEFNKNFKDFRAKRKELMEELNHRKEVNLTLKSEIIDQLRLLNEKTEDDRSFDEFKELQSKWKKIGPVPMPNADKINQNYQALIGLFYDKQSVFSQLKNLDRTLNLKKKEEILSKLAKVQELDEIREITRVAGSLLEEWRNTGPVPKENADDVNGRFKELYTALNDKRSLISNDLQNKRNQNFEAKTEIINQIRQIYVNPVNRSSEWAERDTEIRNWIEKWKAIGGVPNDKREALTNDFKDAISLYNKSRNEFFKQKKNEQFENLRFKNDLLKEAEALLTAEDLNAARIEIINLQKRWKESPPVNGKSSDKVWSQFRKVCDDFFAKLDEQKDGERGQQRENLAKKMALIEKAEGLLNVESFENAREVIDQLRAEWNAIGFVPFKEVEKTKKRFFEAIGKIANKYRGLNREAETLSYKTMIESWKGGNNSNDKTKMDSERYKLNGDLKRIENEISTLANNMEFFKNSKNADALKLNLETQIKRLQEKANDIKDKIKILRTVNNPSEAKNAPVAAPKPEEESK